MNAWHCADGQSTQPLLKAAARANLSFAVTHGQLCLSSHLCRSIYMLPVSGWNIIVSNRNAAMWSNN